MAEINLLKTENSVADQGIGLVSRMVAKAVTALLVLVLLAYGGMYLYGRVDTKKLASIQSDIKLAQSKALQNKDRNELVTRQEQLQNLDSLIKKHMSWSYLLPELARVTLKSAQYTEIIAKSDGKLNLAVTLPGYDDVEKYLQIFDLPEFNQQFSNVRILSISNIQTESSIQTLLRLELTFNPDFIKGR